MLALNNGPSRLSLAALLAAPLVYGLFLAANGLITVTDVRLDETPQRVLTKVTPQMDVTGPVRVDRRLMPIDPAQKPPPLPDFKAETTGVGPVGPVWSGEAPARFDIGPLTFGAISTSPIDGRELVAVRDPLPTMPPGALSRGISGSCDVFFDVDTAGRPQNIAAKCTDNIFKAEAERAVRRAEFLPAIRNGQPVAQKNAIYPIEFTVN
ncbi:MAG: energy transducer TonB [Alphaproteobacteria bacterium HGW-Alphaproteobacteria-18]|nr:MAG: energy transducer TonB [Alphaproteobacteria bacterium HGW-Alphaproteobacteria-18]